MVRNIELAAVLAMQMADIYDPPRRRKGTIKGCGKAKRKERKQERQNRKKGRK